MKKIIWPMLTVLALVLAVVAFLMYWLPEREIALGENTPETETLNAQNTSMPVLSLDGVSVTVGETKVDALLKGGFELKFSKNEKLYNIDTTTQTAGAYMQYQVLLYKGDDCIADLIYFNPQNADVMVTDCTINALSFDAGRSGFSGAKILADGKDLSAVTIGEIPDLFPGFEKTSALYPEYRKSVITQSTSVISDFSARGADGKSITNFEVRIYMSSSSAG